MKRILHYLEVRRRAKRLRRLAENAATTVKTQVIKKELDLYTDDGDLGYC